MYKLTMKEYLVEDRPIEKLISQGVDALKETELLAILIGAGTPDKNALRIAEDILYSDVGKRALLQATVEELTTFAGVGKTKATRIVAGLELGKRLVVRSNFDLISMNDPRTVAEYFYNYFATEDRELFCCVLLDTKNKPISTEVISVGTLNSTLVHPREVFRTAIKKTANAIIVSHNHPSGDPEPSHEDIAITKRLCEVGELVGIPIIDHIVVGHHRFVSLKQRNLM